LNFGERKGTEKEDEKGREGKERVRVKERERK